MAQLEHVNITVSDVAATADVLIKAFGWKIRWQGKTNEGWDAAHVGTEDSYIAMFAPLVPLADAPERYTLAGAMNHIGVVVDDLEAAEARVREAGFEPHAHMDYEPGKRFYFMGPDDVEYEVICYS